MSTLTANEVNEFNTIRKCRDSKNFGMLTAFINNQDCSNFLKVEALLARAYVHLSDGQDSFALQDLKAAKTLANENLEVQYLAELIEGRKFASTVTIGLPSSSPGYPNGRPPSVASSSSHINQSLIPSGDSLSQTPLSMSTMSLDPGPQNPMQQPHPQGPVAPAQRSIIWDDIEIQRQQSLFKLQLIKGEVHKENFCLAYDRPLIHPLHSIATVERDISFSIRSKYPVNLLSVCVYDVTGAPCPWFFIQHVDLYHFATYREPTKIIDCNNNCQWENKERTFHEVIVCKIIFQGKNPPLPGIKAEGYIRFYFSNEESEVKIFQLVQTTSEEFDSITHEKVPIEEYCAPQMPMKKLNIVSSDQNSDIFWHQIEKRYPFKKLREDKCPNVRQLGPKSYKQALHNALFLEESAHMDALMDLSLQTVFLEVDKNKFPCEEGFLLVTFRCPYMVSEESVRGHALMNIATHVMISRKQDRLSLEPNVNVLKADIAQRFFVTEIEQYSHLELKKEFRNLHFFIKIHFDSFKKLMSNADPKDLWLVEFGFDRYHFLECHFATDLIADPSVLFATEDQLSDEKCPPWFVPIALQRRKADRRKAQNDYFMKFKDRYMLTALNTKQQEACEACWYDSGRLNYPPVVINGPFGTGKTFTLSEATRMILESGRSARILICIVSRNTGNVYHQQIVDSNLGSGCLLRLFGKNEDISHVDPRLLEDSNYLNGRFLYPTADHVRSKSVVIVSLDAAMILHRLGIKSSDFSHVFIDEAAQVAEFYLTPILAFASTSNKLVLTGDVMQLNPELLSVPLSEKFGHSIIQRFCNLVYTKYCGFSFTLNVNYRSHKQISEFAYKHFYPGIHYNDRESKADDPVPGVKCLMFVSVWGLQSLHNHLASRCNWVEADKVARVLWKFVNEFKLNGKPKQIGIVTAFKGQVQVCFLKRFS